MTWYWIVLIVIGYFTIGGLIGGTILLKKGDDAYEIALITILLWPIIVPILFAVGLGIIIAEILLNKKK